MNHPLRWVPSCLAVWATATGTLFTSTTTTRCVYTSSFLCVPQTSLILLLISHLFCFWCQLHFEVLHFTCSSDASAEYFLVPTQHFELRSSVCACILLQYVGVCLSPFHSCTSPLIFFMFFHFPQPATRYVSMSVCQGAHTVHFFLSLVLSLSFCFSFCQTVSEEWVCVYLFFNPLFSSPYAVSVCCFLSY